jgi:SPP1 gp7 family putative phage head morphogenesis protein
VILLNNYSLKKHIGAQPGTTVNVPVISETLAFRRAYLAEIRRLLNAIAKTVREQIITSYRSELLTDARESDFEALRNVIKGLLSVTNGTIKRLLELESIRHTERFATAARSAFKIDLAGIVAAEDLEKYVERAALRNAGLVTGMTDDLVKKIQMITTNSLIKGDTVGALRKKLKAEFQISDNRAQLIARDQTSKLNADLNKIRHLQAGVTSYTWRTSRDERVRQLHHAIRNKVYKYNEPTGAESGLEPGQPIRCRCIAQGIVEF